MLKGIPALVSPDLLKVLMEMGHGDEIVLGDAHFPAASCAQRLIRLDGHPMPPILDAILSLMPLDDVGAPVALMAVRQGHLTEDPPIWATYEAITRKHEPTCPPLERVERFAFYERAKRAYAVVATGETAIYANIVLRKGVLS